MAVKTKGQDSENPRKPTATVTNLKVKKKANILNDKIKEQSPRPLVESGEYPFRPIKPFDQPVMDKKSINNLLPKSSKEHIAKSNVVSITKRSKGEAFDSKPPFASPYTSHTTIAANDGEILLQDLNPRLKAWLATYCDMPNNVCWLDKKAKKHHSHVTTISKKVRNKVGMKDRHKKDESPIEWYCYLPMNPVLGWKGRRPPSVTELLIDAYKKGYSFKEASRWDKGKRMTIAAGITSETHQQPPSTEIKEWNEILSPQEDDGEKYYVPMATTGLNEECDKETFYQHEGYEFPGDKRLKEYTTCDRHKDLAVWLYRANKRPRIELTRWSFFDIPTNLIYRYKEGELEQLRYQHTLFRMSITTPHIDYVPDALDSVHGKMGCRRLGIYLRDVAPKERFFKRSNDPYWEDRWLYFSRHAQRCDRREISEEALRAIGRYAYKYLTGSIKYVEPYKPTSGRDSTAIAMSRGAKRVSEAPVSIHLNKSTEELVVEEVKILTENSVKRCKERKTYEERAYLDALRPGLESRLAAQTYHLVLHRGWKKLKGLLVPEGYDEAKGIVAPLAESHSALTINQSSDDESGTMSRLKTG